MRAAAEIEPFALFIDFEILVRRNRIDELHLEGLAMALEPGLGLVARPDFLGEGAVLGDDLGHFLFDRRKILRRERLGAIEIVIEAIFDHRTDRHLRAGIEALYRLSEHMRGVMADELERARILPIDELDLRIVFDGIGEIGELAVDGHGDAALGERGRNALGDFAAAGAGRVRARRAVRKCHANHLRLLKAHSPRPIGVSARIRRVVNAASRRVQSTAIMTSEALISA